MTIDDGEDEFLASAEEAIRRDPGPDAMASLGLWDLLADLGDPDARAATFAVFRAHGRELGRAPALACLMAQPYLGAGDPSPGSVAATLPRHSARRGEVTLLVGEPSLEKILIDRTGYGASILSLDDVELCPVEIAGRLPLHEVVFDPRALSVTIEESRARVARERSRFLGRIAAAFEILGAAESALRLAVEHARAREQFGEPIGRFQAVRHLLAWARTECAAVLGVAEQAVRLDTHAPAHFDEIVKALAGRNGRRVCQRTLQVLGGIGFTAEHEHHHFHSRILALDAMLGTSAELSHGLGRWLREQRSDPRIPSALLVSGAVP